jgi:hypothetical protein
MDRLDDVRLCVLQDLSNGTGVQQPLPLPIELTLHDQRVVITHTDLKRIGRSLKQDIRRLGEPSEFVRAVAAGGESAREIEATLLRVARLLSIPGAGFPITNWQFVLRTYVLQAPSLECAELINCLSKDTPQNIRVLKGVLFSSKPKTPKVEAQMALKLAEELGSLDDGHVQVLDCLGRHVSEMSAADKAGLLDSLLWTLRGARGPSRMSSSALSRCRALCTELAECAGEFSPISVRKAASRLNGMARDAKDSAMKTFAMSLLDKVSRAMRTLPFDHRNHDEAICVALNLRDGHLEDVENQRAAAEILERIVDESHPIEGAKKERIEEVLGAAIRNSRIESDLVPGFEAVLARLMRMEVFSFDARKNKRGR